MSMNINDITSESKPKLQPEVSHVDRVRQLTDRYIALWLEVKHGMRELATVSHRQCNLVDSFEKIRAELTKELTRDGRTISET